MRDQTAFPWEDFDVSAIPVTVGDGIIVEIEADDRPQKLRVAIFAPSEHASDTAAQVVELDPGLKAPLADRWLQTHDKKIELVP